MIADSVTQLIGHTPLLRLNRFSEAECLYTPIIAKVEGFNPGGSAKDRVALNMIARAEERGALAAGATIIEPTSGNTGIGLAMICAVRGYHLILTMPDNMSAERQKLVKAYGAEVVLTPANEGMSGAIRKAQQLNQQIEGSIIMGQFTNPDNPEAHYLTTAQEIWEDTDGKIDIFVAGAGTCGTVCGIGRKLKELNPNIQIVAVEPETSAVLSGEKAGTHGIQGIGAGFIPEIFDPKVVDTIIKCPDKEAIEASRKMALTEGLLTGISSGCAAYAASKLAKLQENKGKVIVFLTPDTGERYLSTELFNL